MHASARAPTVTVVIPVRNGAHYLADCIQSIACQSYRTIVEILVIDGASTDNTAYVAKRFGGVQVLYNSRRIQSEGMNLAINHARGEVIARVDVRTRIAPDYIERAVTTLQRTGAAMVGGPRAWEGRGWQQRGMAAALSSRLGLAGARHYRLNGTAGWADSVYLGVFQRRLVQNAGGYDPTLAVNEDADLAYRLQHLGGVWFDPAIRSTCIVDPTLAALVRKYFSYGRGRARTVLRDPHTLAARQLVAPLLVLALLSPWRRQVIAGYAAIVGVECAIREREDLAAAVSMAVTFPAIHVPWGVGFLFEFLRKSHSVIGRT